ncbi:CHAT domain-containing protein [Micromonospora rhizosphaerae]|uniref:CHAT domain-containing protein n=1 Tax=Micromonospora rhizosphaerae TaxID=568872 RepID=A0A1C6SC45_9ACTN|nr:CHAT domain-containing protein [Micromonospora rhizosphaerae]SCL26912.1 CHAT domain-containing protein [Micromonospora rhizosphaerae]
MRYVASLAARDGRPWAARAAARLLEASALAVGEHLAVDLAVYEINRGAPFEALLHRSLLAGTLGRRATPPQLADPSTVDVGDRLCLWIHELDTSLETIVVAWRSADDQVAACVSELTAAAGRALRDLADSRPARMTPAVCDKLGEKLLGALPLTRQGAAGSVIVIPSPALRPLPVEALTIAGRPVLDPHAPVTVAPALTTWARLPPPPRLSRPYRLVGVFDETLPGAAAEMRYLRALGRAGVIDGQAVLSPGKLGAQLREHHYQVLTLAVHGTVSPSGLTLHLPRGTATGLDVLGWRLPPVVVLAACRSGAAGTIRWPIDLTTACLRRGASSVIVSRWPVADDTTATQMASLYETLADGASPGAALRSAAGHTPDRPLWSWANLAVYGRAD